MAIDPAALRAYLAAAQTAGNPAAATPPMETGAPDFAAMVTNAVASTGDSLRVAETMTAQAATGQAELVDVVTAVAAAEVQLETVMAVRDEVVRAYNDILKMPI
tara:strand:+ start:2455 stop:2766 length:312 start_codon:yes stop_codon:yes gene_type:complete